MDWDSGTLFSANFGILNKSSRVEGSYCIVRICNVDSMILVDLNNLGALVSERLSN